MNLFITGGDRGLGKAIALEVANRKNKLMLTYAHNIKSARETQQEITHYGTVPTMVHLDFLEEATMLRSSRSIKVFLKRTPGLDVVISNAGRLIAYEDRAVSDEEKREMELINYLGPKKLVESYLLGDYPQTKYIFIGSDTIKHRSRYPHCAEYANTKASLQQFVQSLRDRGYDAHCINPPRLDTEMSGGGGLDPAVVANIVRRTIEGQFEGVDIDVEEILGLQPV